MSDLTLDCLVDVPIDIRLRERKRNFIFRPSGRSLCVNFAVVGHCGTHNNYLIIPVRDPTWLLPHVTTDRVEHPHGLRCAIAESDEKLKENKQ